MAAQDVKCPLCETKNVKANQDYDLADRGLERYVCPQCGCFETASQTFLTFSWPEISDRHLLSGLTREHWERHHQPLRIPPTKEEVESLKRMAPHDRDVEEKAMRLLLGLERKTNHPGEQLSCTNTDFALGYSRHLYEFDFLIRYLAEREFIQSFIAHSSGWGGVISAAGWAAIESYRAPNSESDKVFVAMWFDDETSDAYSGGIRPAIEDDCGYRAVRIDTKDFLGDIVDEIIAEVRESRFIVADFTGQRHGVYYEAGYARGMGLPVILTCRKDHIDGLHFDTRQQNHIVWEAVAEFRQRLASRIRAVIGIGPRKKA